MIKKDKKCMLCPYKHEEDCLNNHDKCYSLSNIYSGLCTKYFPFKQIEYYKTKKAWKKEEEYYEQMDKKYGDCSLENDEQKFIWGIKSFSDLCGKDTCLYTMNEIDIVYDKEHQVFMLGVETAYLFKTREEECEYLKDCLNAFTKFMDDNGYDKNERYMFFMSNPCTSMTAKTIPELYTNFKIFVNGFCSLEEK